MRAIIAFLLVLLPSVSLAEGQWIADSKGCKVWSPNPAANESITWSGRCVNGVANGRGILLWFVEGKFHSSYEGSLANGQSRGRGVWISATGDRYEGNWVAGKKYGHGVYTWANGHRYRGNWLNDQKHGYGRYTWADGDRYEGNFLSDMAHGLGTKTNADGEIFKGQWSKGCFRQGNQLEAIGTTFKECGFVLTP